MICSIVTLSRNRPDGLHTAIESLVRNAERPGDVEFLIRFDDDDGVSLTRAEEFEEYPNTKIVVGPRNSLPSMTTELLKVAQGEWVCMFNDDAHLTGYGWDNVLASSPKEGIILQPENYWVNASCYYQSKKTGFPFFPNKIWEHKHFEGFLDSPHDHRLIDMADEARWHVCFMPGITIHHDWRQ